MRFHVENRWFVSNRMRSDCEIILLGKMNSEIVIYDNRVTSKRVQIKNQTLLCKRMRQMTI